MTEVSQNRKTYLHRSAVDRTILCDVWSRRCCDGSYTKVRNGNSVDSNWVRWLWRDGMRDGSKL